MSKIKVLIVEDDIICASKLEIALVELGYEVVDIVNNKDDGLKSFFATHPDIAIIDISLEEKFDGIIVAEEIRADKKNSKPVIFLTASEDTETFERAKSSNPSAFLLKPFETKSLKYAIEIALQNFSMSTESISLEQDAGFFLKDNIFIKKDKRLVKVPLFEIMFIEVDAKYCIIHTETNRYTIRISLKELEVLAAKENLIRVHRNYLVNSSKIKEFDLENDVININENLIPLGKSYKRGILDSLKYFK